VKEKGLKVSPALFYVHRAAKEDYSPTIEIGERTGKERVEDFAPYEEPFRQRLDALLREIFQPDIPFTQTEFKEKCEYCDFRALCKK
jgi:hypothetical protein